LIASHKINLAKNDETTHSHSYQSKILFSIKPNCVNRYELNGAPRE
jgi:hypothetical protein